MKTYTPKAGDIERAWHVIDAEGKSLGRLASEVAQLLKGKHKGETVSKERLVEEDLAWHPTCIERHLTGALRMLEADSVIRLHPPGGTRKQGSFPSGSRIDFIP